MPQYTRYIGFDVSADTIVIAEARPGRDRARDLGTSCIHNLQPSKEGLSLPGRNSWLSDSSVRTSGHDAVR
jgi:hypothetical protein